MTEFFLGHPVIYWIELERRAKTEGGLSTPRLLDEIAALRAKVSFYESRIKEMARLL